MRLNWTIKLHVHNHYCGKIGELSLDITCQPLGMFEMTIFLLRLHFNAHLLWNPQCGYMHQHDDQSLMIAMYGSIDEGFWSAFSEIYNSQPSCLIYLYLFICLSLYILYMYFISLSPLVFIWECGLDCLATHDKACYCKNLLVNGGRMSIRAETCSSGWFEECVRVQTRITRLRLNIKKANGKKPLLPIN